MAVEIVTSGAGLDEPVATQIRAAGVRSVTVSVDGTEVAHDRQRGVAGSYRAALSAIGALDSGGLRVGVNTQVNRESLPTLDDLAPAIEAAGAMGWQLQLTIPMGRAKRAGVALDPEHMAELYHTVRRLIRRRGLRPVITDNIGYGTPDDPILRTPPGCLARCWLGCFAGVRHLAVTSDGRVKGCLTLPDSLSEGSVRGARLAAIWADPERFSYTRRFDPSQLAGPCKNCSEAEICRGGCTATAIAHHGRPHECTHCFRHTVTPAEQGASHETRCL
jgi:radical SAM protein with 4Fe4S-binding SPASM domain